MNTVTMRLLKQGKSLATYVPTNTDGSDADPTRCLVPQLYIRISHYAALGVLPARLTLTLTES